MLWLLLTTNCCAGFGPIVDLGYGLWQATFNASGDFHDTSGSNLTHPDIAGHWRLLQLQKHPLCSTTSRGLALRSTAATVG